MKVALCLPVYDTFKAKTTVALLELMGHSLAQKIIYNGEPVYPEIHALYCIGTRIAEAREQLAERALERGVDYLLWIDADMTFPPDALLALAKHNLKLVGTNYLWRRENLPTSTRGGERVWTRPESTGLEQVDTMGFGVCLMKAELLRAIPRPWFQDSPSGEDGWFCAQAIKAGATPHIDHDLSKQVGHIAETVLRFT